MPDEPLKPILPKRERPLPAGMRPALAPPPPRRTLLMGRPMHFASIDPRPGGPAAERPASFRSRIDRDLAFKQWHALAELLTERGFEVLAIHAEKKFPGLAYAGAAGLLLDRGRNSPVESKSFITATPPPGEAELHQQFERVIRGIGFQTAPLNGQFAGAADFIKCGDNYLFTPGADSEASGVPLGGLRLPSFLGGRAGKGQWGSEPRVREQLAELVPESEVIELRITDPRFPRGDLVCHPIGPGRRMLMIYVKAFHSDARALLLSRKSKVAEYLIPIEDADAAIYAANSLQFTEKGDKHYIIIPEGVSKQLLGRIEAVGITPIPINLSEWIKKDRGSVRSLITDLGWICTDRRTEPQVADFRRSLRFVPSEPAAAPPAPLAHSDAEEGASPRATRG